MVTKPIINEPANKTDMPRRIDRLVLQLNDAFNALQGKSGNITEGNLTISDLTDEVTAVTLVIFSNAIVSPTSGTGTATVTVPSAIFVMTPGD
jgi:hypothetical protein